MQFLSAVFPMTMRFLIFDTDAERAARFKVKQLARKSDCEVDIAQDCAEVLNTAEIVSIATTATAPHIGSFSSCKPNATILHISLRDIAPNALLECDNIADDIDHFYRENTSVHIAE